MAEQKYIRPDMTVIIDQLKQLEMNDRKLRFEVDKLRAKNKRLEATLERLDVLYIEQHHYFKKITQARQENGNALTGILSNGSLNSQQSRDTIGNGHVQPKSILTNGYAKSETNSSRLSTPPTTRSENGLGVPNPIFNKSFEEPVPSKMTDEYQGDDTEHPQSEDTTESHHYEGMDWGSSRLDDARELQRDTFKIPGLTKICIGYVIEKIIWAILLTGGIGVATYFSWKLYQQYDRHEVVSYVRSLATRKLPLPSITVCSDRIYLQSLQCYKNRTIADICDTNSTLMIKNCYFRGSSCLSNVVTSEWEPGCVTINPNETMVQEGLLPLTDFILIFPNQVGVVRTYSIFLHKASEKPTSLHKYGRLQIYPGEYHIQIRKTIFERESSTCVDNTDIATSGSRTKYTKATCQDNCYLVHLQNTCQAIPDIWHHQMPKDDSQALNNTDDEKRTCLHKELNDLLRTGYTPCECQEPCMEETFHAHVHDLNAGANADLTLQISYQSLSYEHITERPLYAMERFIADVGGLLALFAGVTVLAVLEIVAYWILLIASMNCTKTRTNEKAAP